VELVIKSKIYRVGQSYFGGIDGTLIYTISMIHPNTRKAKCLKYMQMKDSFASPKVHDNSYVLLGEDVTLDLAVLKTPYKKAFTKFSMKYDQDDDNQRSFAYYNDTGKIQHHPTGRPTVCELSKIALIAIINWYAHLSTYALSCPSLSSICSGFVCRGRRHVSRDGKIFRCEMDRGQQ
jgi:hypothetical protein